MRFKNIAIVGAGAIGSFYGAKLQHYGLHVQYQTRSGARELAENNMSIKSVWGDFSVKADVHESTQTMNAADLIFVTTKALPDIDYKSIISPVIKTHSVILLIQNGLNLDEELKRIFPSQTVLGATAFVCLNRESPSDIRHLAYGHLDIGYLQEDDKSIAEDIANLLKSAGIEADLAGYIRELRWKKLLWNIPFNVLSVILVKANTMEMIGDNNIFNMAIELMKEVQSVALSENIIIKDADIDKMIASTRAMVPYKTSMLLDFENNRPMEVDAILRETLKAAGSAGIKVPRIELLFAQLKFIDSHRR